MNPKMILSFYKIKEVDIIYLVDQKNRLRQFLSNSKYIFVYGFFYGIGHFLSSCLIKATLLDLRNFIN